MTKVLVVLDSEDVVQNVLVVLVSEDVVKEVSLQAASNNAGLVPVATALRWPLSDVKVAPKVNAL